MPVSGVAWRYVHATTAATKQVDRVRINPCNKKTHLWCRHNLLEVNARKTKVMYFSSKYLNSTSKPYKKLCFGGNDLDYVDDYRYLGLTIDTWLTFAQHINNTLKTLSFRVMQLKRIRNCITHKIALQLFKSMILPIMDYADIFCHNKSTRLIKKFQVIQNRCIRIISGFSRLTNKDEEATKLGLLPLSNRRALHILQFALELSTKQPELTESFGLNPLDRMTTRPCNPSRTQFKMFRPIKTLIERSISYMIRSRWNALPTMAHKSLDKNTLASYLLANPNLEFWTSQTQANLRLRSE